MRAVIRIFWQICLLRGGPQHVPTQPWFVASVVLASLSLVALITRFYDGQSTTLHIVTRTVVYHSASAFLLWLALYLRELSNRFPASLTALFGCNLITFAVVSAIIPAAQLLGEGALALLMLIYLVWSTSVAGFILHRALDVALGIGIGLAIGMSFLSLAISQVAAGA